MSSACCGWSAPAAGRSAAWSCSRRWRSASAPRRVGIGVGLLLAAGLESLFTSMGLSLPIAGMSLSGGTVIAALIVGVGVTLVAALLPARRATKVAPVAALREAGDAVSRVRLPGRVLRWVTGLVGRPSARVGGSAGRLARTNAMRHPGRTAVHGVGAADRRRAGDGGDGGGQGPAGRLRRARSSGACRRPRWSRRPTAGRRSIPRRAGTVASAPGVTAVSSLAQDGALAFGEEEGVNAVDPGHRERGVRLRPEGGRRGGDRRPRAATARWSTTAGRPSTACGSATRSPSPRPRARSWT